MRARLAVLALVCALARAQAPEKLLERLEKLEEQNRALQGEIQALKDELKKMKESPAGGAGSSAFAKATADKAADEPADKSADKPLEERVEVAERRIEELAQTKVGASNKFPVQLTGYVLFNAFLNGASSGDSSHPTTASLNPTMPFGGATFRQSVLGLKFQGPGLPGGGKVNGSFYMDFFGGTGTALNSLLRIRVATIDLDWKNTTISAGQDKPIMAPREPTSLAMVGVSPLTQAGNLWFWLPQVRVEQRWQLAPAAGVKLQLGVVQTNESTNGVPTDYVGTLSRARPGWEGRLELWKEFEGGRRVEIAPAFHASDSKVDGEALPSRIYALDWLVRPWHRLELTGTYYAGTNTNVLGGLRPGITYFANGTQRVAHGAGGFAQISLKATRNATFNFYAGQESHRARDLAAGSMLRNLVYAGNVIYRLGPNVMASFEVYQARTLYLGSGLRLVPHYDLALAYSF